MKRRSRWTISQCKQAIKETRDNLEYRYEKIAWFTVKYNDTLQETEVIHSHRLLDLAETDPSIFVSVEKQFKQLSLRGSEPPQYLQDWQKKSLQMSSRDCWRLLGHLKNTLFTS